MSAPAVCRPSLPLVCAAALLLGGCAGMRGADEPPPSVSTPAATLPDGSVRVDTDDERIAQLWTAAEEARRLGNDSAALELLYEALELDQRNALLWSRAAEIQLDDENPAQAENFAVKSNAFAGDNNTLLYRNWLMIEQARDMRGDLLGMRSAHKRVQQYQYR